MGRILSILTALSLVLAAPAFAAASSSSSYTMKASVLDEITISVLWYATNGAPAPADLVSGTTIDWSNLGFDPVNFVFQNDKARLALITANNHSRSYVVTQTGTALTAGANSIPNAKYTVAPTYVSADNGGVTEGTMGATGTAVAVNKNIYTSGGTHGARVLRAYYSITNVAMDQPVGNYAGTLQFTITG